MTNLEDLVLKTTEIWGEKDLGVDELIPVLGKIYGDLCRIVREYHESDCWELDEEEFTRELGNLLLTSLRYLNQFKVVEISLTRALYSQREYKRSLDESRRLR